MGLISSLIFGDLVILSVIASLVDSTTTLSLFGKWAVYHATAAPAPDACLVTEFEKADDTCCTASSADITMHSSLKG